MFFILLSSLVFANEDCIVKKVSFPNLNSEQVAVLKKLRAKCKKSAYDSLPGAIPQKGEPFATINKKQLGENIISSLLSRVPESQREEILGRKEVLKELKEQLITTEVLYQKALEMGLHEKEEYRLAMALSQKEVLASAFVEAKLEEALTDKVLRAQYDADISQYEKQEADISMIMVSTESKAKEVLALLNAGGDFAELAGIHSEDSRTQKGGGRMGEVDVKLLPPNVRTPVSQSKSGDVIGPIGIIGKFALIKIHSLKMETDFFEDVKEVIKEEMKQKAGKEITEQMLQEATIERFEK